MVAVPARDAHGYVRWGGGVSGGVDGRVPSGFTTVPIARVVAVWSSKAPVAVFLVGPGREQLWLPRLLWVGQAESAVLLAPKPLVA